MKIIKILKYLVLVIIIVVAVIFSYKYYSTDSTEKKSIQYIGCGIVKKAFMTEMAKVYTAKTGIKIEIEGGGDQKGIRSVASGKSGIAGACRHPVEHHLEKNVKPYIIAWGALVVIVHESNPVDNINRKDLRKVLIGEIRTWKKLGGKKNLGIAVLARKSSSSGVGRMARELIFNDIELNYYPQSYIYSSTGPLERSLDSIPNGIAISGDSSAKKRDLKILSVNGIYPSYSNVASGKYSLVEPLYLYLGPKSGKKDKAFLKFVLSSEGQRIIRSQGTVTVADAREGGLYAKFARKMSSLGVTNWK